MLYKLVAVAVGVVVVAGIFIYGTYFSSTPEPDLAERTPNPSPNKKNTVSPTLQDKLVAVCEKFKGFASADALRFEHCICLFKYINDPTYGNFARVYVDEIKNRVTKLSTQQVSVLKQSTIPVLLNKISEKQLLESVKWVKQAGGGACTNFALAAAGRIIKSFEKRGEPVPHIEIIAHDNGRGSHLFVLANRNPHAPLNNPDLWNDDCYIVDAWAMSMGYSSGIINGAQYNYGNGVYRWGDRINHPDNTKHYPFSGMLTNLESIFDNFSGNIQGHKLKLQ